MNRQCRDRGQRRRRRSDQRLTVAAITVLSAFALLPVPSSQAQTRIASVRRPPPWRHLPPPVLIIRQHKRSVPLKLASVDIRATVVGHLAETRVTMVFYNPNNRVHEGELFFPLPQGSTISGYAIDVKGRMVDGVVVGRDRARQVYETEVRAGVDPGIVEWTKGRNFRTRIFPIPARGTRRVRVSYVSDVEQRGGRSVYRLPLGLRQTVGAISLRVEVVKAVAKPLVVQGGPRGLSFGAVRDSFVASAKLRNAKLNRDLVVALPRVETRPITVARASDGQHYFAIHDRVAPRASGTRIKPKRIALYWDASLSRRGKSHQKELDLLRRYLQQLGGPVRVELVVFRNVPERPRRFDLPQQRAALLATLRGVAYDGGTQLGAIRALSGARKPDLVLLFSDGLSTLGQEKPPKLGAPVFAINSASGANHALLRYLALRSGGAYVNLARLSSEAASSTIGAQAFSFIGAEVSGSAKLTSLYPQVRAPVHGSFSLAGKLDGASATVTLKYGFGDKVTLRRQLVIKRSAASTRRAAVGRDLLRRYWAQKKLDDLLIFPAQNKAAISALGRRYSIVTPGTSLIVLERLDQYVKHRIRPPASLTKMRLAYDKTRQQQQMTKRRQRRSKLERVIAMWNKRVAWWSKRFRYPRNFRYGEVRRKKGRRRNGHGFAFGAAGAARAGGARPPMRLLARRRRPSAEPQAVAKDKKKTGGRRGPSMRIKAWDPKTPYIAALKQASRARRYAVYLQQRKKHGAAPAFYFDCANYLRRKGMYRLALRVLTSLADLELDSPALLRVLAHRLAQVNELALAAAIFDKVLEMRPEEPQSYRDLALVLERRADKRRRWRHRRAAARADYERALDLLAKVVMGKWSRFAEIEVIALTELNNIWPKARRLGVRRPPVDRRLIKQLKMDVRIVMSWDADLTDMDLHVIEPSREHAYYSHNRTTIGGLVSRDFTRGYGPEVYALRRAMRGKYRIRTKYYGSSAAKLAGGVTLQVDVFTNYGRRNQRRRSITLRLTKRKEIFDVGSIRF